MKGRLNSIGRFFIAFLFLFGSVQVFAQDDLEEDNECVRTLKKAQKAYDDGLIEKVEQMVRRCLESGELKKEEQLEGYRLIALANLYDGKDKQAEDAMLQFLKIEPEYTLQPGVDPKEFSELYSNYHTSPLYTVGIYFGPNWTSAQSYKEYGAYNTESDKKEFKSRVGFQIGLRGTRYIHKGLNVHLDLAFNQNSFEYSQDILESYTRVDANAEGSPTKGVTIESIESHTALTIPISFSYTFMLHKQIRPYVIAGFETRLLLSATNSISKSYFDQDIAAVEVSDVDNFKDNRNGATFGALFGIGGKYKITRGDIFVELKYNVGISDQVKRDAVDVNDDVRLWDFYNQDNDFTMNNLLFNVGYNLYLYKPRKMKAPNKVKEAKEPKQPKEKKVKEEKAPKEKKGDNKRRIIE